VGQDHGVKPLKIYGTLSHNNMRAFKILLDFKQRTHIMKKNISASGDVSSFHAWRRGLLKPANS
jgi:hypothetical protein